MNKVYIVYKDNGKEIFTQDYNYWVEYVTISKRKAIQLLINDDYTKMQENNAFISFENGNHKAWIEQEEITQ